MSELALRTAMEIDAAILRNRTRPQKEGLSERKMRDSNRRGLHFRTIKHEIIRLYNEGVKVPAIAERLHTSESYAYNVISRAGGK